MDSGFQADCLTIEAIEVEGVAVAVMFWLLRVGFRFKCCDLFRDQCRTDILWHVSTSINDHHM